MITRRTFTASTLGAGAAIFTLPGISAAAERKSKLMFGICSGPDREGKLKSAGFEYVEGGVGGTLIPDKPDSDFAPKLEAIKNSQIPMHACNGFIPARLKLTGPDADHEKALEYAETACRRGEQAGINFIVLGSGGARKIPDGFDHDKGREQFISFCRKLGERIHDLKLTVVLEPLQKQETNLLNRVDEGIKFVDDINHPRIQLLADFYHMMREDEGPDSIRKAGARIRHCHIAELEKRMAPGTKGEDLSGFFKALHDINYQGGISCECGWPKEDREAAWRKAVVTMRQQAGV